jgi:hypothetical protein
VALDSDSHSTGYRLKAGPGIALSKDGKAIQIGVEQSGAGDIPVADLVPGAANTTLVTNPAGTQATWVQAIASTTPSGLNIDWSLGNVFSKTLGAGANAVTFSNTADGQTIVVVLTGAASTVTWPGGVKWTGGVAPTQTANGTDVYTFVDVGGTFYGSVIQAFA